MLRYSAVDSFRSVEETQDGLTDCGEMANGECLVAANISLVTSTVPTEGQRRGRPNMTRRRNISASPISHSLEIPSATNRALYYNAFKPLYPTVAATETELNTLK